MAYGISFKGSKSKIAKDIVAQLPSGNRLVDLFGGGGAITHCAAVTSNKWNSILYNDINPLLPKLLQEAISGKYNYDVFAPEFVDRETFNKYKNKDGYIKYVWSFGSNGQDYLYGKNIEMIKHLGHDLVMFGMKSNYLESIVPGITDAVVDAKSINDKRIEYSRYIKNARCNDRGLEHLERIKRLQHLEHLERIERLQHLERIDRLQDINGIIKNKPIQFTSINYKDYKYQDGDVVYCDIPYFNCANNHRNYDVDFNHGEFYEWCISRDYPVYVSSYSFIKEIWHKQVWSVMNSGAGGGVKRTETLYRFN